MKNPSSPTIIAERDVPIERVTEFDDPRLDPFRDVRSGSPPAGRFIAESWLVVERLLSSSFHCESIVVSERRFRTLEPLLPTDRPVYRLPNDLADALVGYDFHNGVLACGVRRSATSVRDLPAILESDPNEPQIVVTLPRATDPVNLATLVRTTRALGGTALLLGADCPDPFSRRVLRVSVGNVFFLPIVESRDLAAELDWLQTACGFEVVGSTLDPTAEPLETASRTRRLVLMLGHEYDGLGANWLERCDRLVTIPMAEHADSLNIATAAGIMLYYYSRIAKVAFNPTGNDR